MYEKDLNHVFKNKYKNTSIALPKSCTLYTIQSEMYVGIYAFFMLGKNLAGEYVCYYLAWLFSISIDILVHIGNKIYMLD